MPSVEGVEEEDLVDPVEELRPEMAAHDRVDLPPRRLVRIPCAAPSGDQVTAQIRGHDHDHVAEVYGAAPTVRQAAVVEELQQDVQHVGVRLLHLVEEHDGVGTPAHRLGELPGLVVTDVAGRRAHEPRHGVLLLVLRHVDADHRPLVVEEELGQGPRQLRLPDAGRSEEQEAPQWAARILQPGPRPAHGVGDGDDGVVLSDDAAPQRSSMCTSFSISPSTSLATGMCVHLLTTAAMSCSSTSSLSMRGAAAADPSRPERSCCSSSGMRPYCSSDARA